MHEVASAPGRMRGRAYGWTRIVTACLCLASVGFGCAVPASAPRLRTPSPFPHPATAVPTTPPKSTVVFAFATGGDGAYVVGADGTGGRAVAEGVCTAEREPGIRSLALSPEGRRLAFVCALSGDEPGAQGTYPSRLYLLDLATGAPQRIADEVAEGPGSLAWSPDGRYLAYHRLVDIGPAPVSASEVWAYETAAGRHVRLDEGRYFVSPPVWDADGSAVVYRVGAWQSPNYTGPVATYRAPLDGSGGRQWLGHVEAVVPGADGQWLGVREPRDREGGGQAVLIAPDGAVKAVAPPTGVVERPLGWLGPDPVVWRQAAPPDSSQAGRGEAWLLGQPPRRLLSDLPLVDVRPAAHDHGAGTLLGEQLVYVDGGTIWLADLRGGQRKRFEVHDERRPALRMDTFRVTVLRSTEDLVREVTRADGRGYPAVVARVNGHEISGRDLQIRVLVMRNSGNPNPPADIERAALDSLIREAVLRDAAAAQGVTVSEAEAAAYARSTIELAKSSGDRTGADIVEATARGMGLSLEQYADDPRVIALYRDVLLLSRMGQRIAGTLPPERRQDPGALDAAIQQLVASARAEKFVGR